MADTSQLIDYLPSYVFPTAERRLCKNIVCGISLGGHAAWQCIFLEPRITAGISVIGCPDYIRLMSDRARLSKLRSWSDGTFIGSQDFPKDLLNVVSTHDPASLTLRNLCSLEDRDSFLGKILTEQDGALIEERLQLLRGKVFFNLSGAEDKLVPYRASEPYVNWLMNNVTSTVANINVDFQLRNKIYDGVGHTLTLDMAMDVERFIVDILSQSSQVSQSPNVETAKI